MVTAARFRALALALPGAIEVPHMERAAFRTKRRIFATLPPDGETANLGLIPELQAAVLEELSYAFHPVPGGWGKMGHTTVNLTVVSEEDLARVLGLAHELASQPKGSRPPSSASGSKKTRKR
jgi:hypothetical protein